jgi:exopolysaccharide biosynthesis polyprenyl glycosylphosphotransferase
MVETSLISELKAVIDTEPVDEVFITLPRDKYGHVIEDIVHLCEEQGIIVRVHHDMLNPWFALQFARWHVDLLDGMPMVTIRSGPPDGWELMAKRVIDVCGSMMLLLATAPLLLLAALLIKLDSPGPILFRQERVGLNKRRFALIKFRTMGTDAERQQTLMESLNEADGPVFKIKKDPRVTRVGRFLRRFSIDELPQLFNVLKGEMSLVGPRPLPVRDAERMVVQWHKRRFSMKPGLTCLWQVNGRSDVNFDHWVRLDLQYIDNWSLEMDLKILLKTIPTVLKGAGAY